MNVRQLVYRRLLLALLACAKGGALAASVAYAYADESEEAKNIVSMTYAWPFLPPEQMQPRGGTTQGAKSTLDPGPHKAWSALQEAGLSALEQDRRAILAMAGAYRVSFQFIETMGFTDGYRPPRPYFSWGTEDVRVLESSDRFISLQHTLVMYFADEEKEGEQGGAEQAYVTKHWRQDWTYEDADLHAYRGNRVWERKRLSPQEAAGRWSQAVYQVDDSPRYETMGRWEHLGGSHRWTSDDAWRPLPRREFSVRDDYNVLSGINTLTIVPDGWVHSQENRKLAVEDGGAKVRCLASETGINRYERIATPDVVGPASQYLSATGEYWREVRSMWAEVLAKRDRFEVKETDGGARLYEEHFGYADQIERSGTYDPQAGREHARATIRRFLAD